jgi:hypothetical protein
MRVGNWKTILDAYEWLPPYGESAVSAVIAGSEAKLIVDYDVTVDGTDQRSLRRREIVFHRAFYF